MTLMMKNYHKTSDLDGGIKLGEKLGLMENKREELMSVLAQWGLTGELEIEEEYEGHVWTVNEDYILKMTQSGEEIKNNLLVTSLLTEVGIPAQKVVETVSKERYVQVNEDYYVLVTKLKGHVLVDYYEGDYVSRAFYLGQCLASLHEKLKQIEVNYELWDNKMTDELSGWVKEEILHYLNHCSLPQQELEQFKIIKSKFETCFNELYVQLPRQVIHRDFHGGNLIFQDEKLVGYIDFDISQINARLFDVCYLCTGALVGVFNEPEKREKWIHFSKKVIEGYESQTSLTREEYQSLKYMMIAIEFIMIAYFAKAGNEEVANTNVQMVNWIESVWGA